MHAVLDLPRAGQPSQGLGRSSCGGANLGEHHLGPKPAFGVVERLDQKRHGLLPHVGKGVESGHHGGRIGVAQLLPNHGKQLLLRRADLSQGSRCRPPGPGIGMHKRAR